MRNSFGVALDLPPGLLGGMPAVEWVDMSENHFGGTIQENSFSTLSHLKFLNLGRNSFKKIAIGAFRGLTALEELQLEMNEYLEFGPAEGQIQNGTFTGLPNLKVLRFADGSDQWGEVYNE